MNFDKFMNGVVGAGVVSTFAAIFLLVASLSLSIASSAYEGYSRAERANKEFDYFKLRDKCDDLRIQLQDCRNQQAKK